MKSEACACCSLTPPVGTTHPWIGVINLADLGDLVPVAKNTNWAAVAVCTNCHTHPDKRPTQIKAHFFPRSDVAKAVGNAGSDHIGGR